MAKILSLDTSTPVCSVAIHENGELLASQTHQVEKSHSSLLPQIALDVCEEIGISMQQLDAIAIASGPGSYTGLRIGASSAKGFCYGLSLPLIAIPTLDVMIEAVASNLKGNFLVCPMLDARRMEVYTKLQNKKGEVIWETQPKILDEGSFQEFGETIYIFGDGMPKFQEICRQNNLIFIDEIFPEAKNMGRIAFQKFQNEVFEDVAYYEPFYLKEWQGTTQKKNLLVAKNGRNS